MRIGLSCFAAPLMLLAASSVAEDAEDATPGSLGAPPPPAEAIVAAIPFEDSDESNRIFIDLAPEGHRELKVLLDTGATFTTFTPLFARSLGISVRRTKSSPYRRPTRLGRDLQFYIDTESSDTGSKTGFEYGLLGGNFLQEYVVEFNFAARMVTFLDPKKFRVPKKVDAPNEEVLRIRIVSGRPVVKIGMNGKKIGVLLDTGAHDPLIMSGAAAKKLGVDVGALPPFGVFGTVMGPMPVSLLETDSFTLGKFEFDSMPVMVAPKGWYNQGSNSDSVIGFDTLRQFTIRIDYPRQRMWLRRESTMVTYQGVDYTVTRKLGLFLDEQSTHYSVIGVLDDTPASALGLRPGDAIVKPGGSGRPELDRVIEAVGAGGPIHVMRQRGRDDWTEVALGQNAALDGDGGPTGNGSGISASDLWPAEDPAAEALRRQRLREQAEELDRTREERWEQKTRESLYVLDDGGWMKVDNRRRRNGPADGENWVSFDEMQRIKRESEGMGEGDVEAEGSGGL